MANISKKHRLKNTYSRTYLDNFFDIFYPGLCVACNRELLESKRILCHMCISDLPRCDFSHFESNPAEVLFRGRIEIQGVTSLLYFRKKGMVQRLMHALKYRGREDIGDLLGGILAEEIRQSQRFDTVDLILPVPLHPSRLRSRGYNQVSQFGRSLSKALELPFEQGALKRRRPGVSQTGKSREARNQNLGNSFMIKKAKTLINKHVLIVDDIITSGATLESCARKVLEVPGTRVSLGSMAFTL